MDTSRQRIRDIRFLMAPLCEGICRRRRLRGVSKGNTQKNHETRESILRTDFAGLGERDGKSAENGLQNRFSSTKNSLQHAVRKCENQKSYPHSCAQMWVNSADNSWITLFCCGKLVHNRDLDVENSNSTNWLWKTRPLIHKPCRICPQFSGTYEPLQL